MVGWQLRFGAEATAAAVRTWSRYGEILAVGMLDSPTLLRLAVALGVQRDEQLARQLVADVTLPERGVLPPGNVAVEARFGGPFRSPADSEQSAPDRPRDHDGQVVTSGRTASGVPSLAGGQCGSNVPPTTPWRPVTVDASGRSALRGRGAKRARLAAHGIIA